LNFFSIWAEISTARESEILAGIVARTERGLDFHANTGPQRGAPAVLDRIAS